MKKILFILVATMIISSCATESDQTTFIVKFKDGTEMKVAGIGTSATKNGFYIYHGDSKSSVFSKDDVLYIIKSDYETLDSKR